MAAIKGRDTKPEIAVRSMLDALKVKYELHRADLPGKPDIVLPRRKKIIFVHGCFWHVHACRYGRVKPASNASFWSDKRGKNKLRDARNRVALRRDGWTLLTVWECWTKKPKKLTEKLASFLSA
jgi:DNA mismatch endonuclease (patch repair protein)